MGLMMKVPNLEELGREEPAESVFIEPPDLIPAIVIQRQNLGVSYMLGI